MDFYIGGIISFAGTFNPKGWSFCQGQIVDIAQYPALYSLLGTVWGGDGRISFCLPDLRGRVPRGAGYFPGYTPSIPGQFIGVEQYHLSIPELPSHSHTATFTGIGGGGGQPITATVKAQANKDIGDTNDAEGNYWATGGDSFNPVINAYSTTANAAMASDAVEVVITGGGGGITGGTVTVDNNGGSQSFSIMQPSLGIHYIICMDDIYPLRN